MNAQTDRPVEISEARPSAVQPTPAASLNGQQQGQPLSKLWQPLLDSLTKGRSRRTPPEGDRDWLTGAVSAAVGAGVAVSFSVALGQSPWTAMGVTVFSAGLALVVDRLGWL